MRELSFDEINDVVGAGRATGGPINQGGDQTCSNQVMLGAVGGAIMGAATPYAARLGFIGGGIMTFAGSSSCMEYVTDGSSTKYH